MASDGGAASCIVSAEGRLTASFVPRSPSFAAMSVFAVMAARKQGPGPEWPLCAFLRAWALTSPPLTLRVAWTLAGHSPIWSLFKETPRRRAKSRSLALQKRNVSLLGRGIAEHLCLKWGPSGSALAVCVQLILLAVRGQIETKQSTVRGSHYILPDVYYMDFQGKGNPS